MDLFLSLSRERARVTDADLLGEGGEARVYRYKTLALKVFHEVDAKDAMATRVRTQKLEKLARFPSKLPGSVLAPLESVTDAQGTVLGYAMKALEQAFDFSRLGSKRFREGVISNEAVMALFRSLSTTVEALHTRGVVVGDLNDGNVLFRGPEAYLIDTDSLQFASLPCAVAHERFLDPQLYGADLSQAPRFTDGTDWYAFAVMLFSSLLYVHPFGGTHPKLPTLLRRAEARHSIMHSDVTLPRNAVKPQVLSDDALDYFSRVFDKNERKPVPPALLNLKWTRCRCGVEHARAACPECHALGPLLTRPVIRANGRCTARVAFETSGRILHAALQGGLRYLYEEEGVGVRREDGTVVRTAPTTPGMTFALCGPSTWVADAQGRVECIKQGTVVERTQTQVRGTEPLLCATASHVFRQEAEWLVEHLSGARVGQVLEAQTSLWLGERLGLGFYRAGGFTFAFLLKPGSAGIRRLEGVTWQGRIVEAEAVFDATHALLSVAIELNGREASHRWLFNDAGQLLAEQRGGSPGHAALLFGRVVLATDRGLIGLKVDSNHLIEATHFTDTQPFVSAGDELLPQPDGSLYVVGSRDIKQLTLT